MRVLMIKHRVSLQTATVLWLGLSLCNAALAAADRLQACKVADPELQGTFVGQCDGWGVANGMASVTGTATYVGEFKDGKKHGYGVKTWRSGEQYVGHFANDMKSGYGIYKWPAKDARYPGDQAAGARDIYIGQFLNDQREGEGTYTWSSGDVYRGQWQGDKFIATPTPMMQLQEKHDKALALAVKQPSIHVCRVMREGTTRTQSLHAKVISVNTDTLTLLLTEVPSGLADRYRPNQIINDSYLNWEPCES